MSSLNQDSPVSGQYRIVDSLQAFLLLVFSVAAVVIAGYFIHKGALTGGLAVGLIGVALFLAFRVNAKGYIADVEADTLEYPGGGIAADSILSYLSPNFLLQFFKRYTLNISDIRHVDVYSETKRRVSDSGKVSSKTTHYLDVNGEFGAISFSFVTKGKRDELYSLLVQLNEMGNPILNR
jgi:hypothetical protein